MMAIRISVRKAYLQYDECRKTKSYKRPLINYLGCSCDHRKNMRLLELSLDPSKCTKILHGSYVITINLRTRLKKSWTRPYEWSTNGFVLSF